MGDVRILEKDVIQQTDRNGRFQGYIVAASLELVDIVCLPLSTTDRYNRKVVSLAVLGDERASWRPDRYRHELCGCTLEFRFPIVKLIDYSDRMEDLERSSNPFAMSELLCICNPWQLKATVKVAMPGILFGQGKRRPESSGLASPLMV